MAKIIINNKKCQIIEENDVEFLRSLYDNLSFDVQGAQYTPSYRGYVDAKGNFVKWDGKQHLLSEDLRFDYGLLSRVKDFFIKNEKTFLIEDLRDPKTPSIKIDISENLKLINKIPFHYQLEAVEAAKNNDCGILRMATGAGKCSHKESLHITEYGLLNYEELINFKKMNSGELLPLQIDVATPISNKDTSSHIYYDGYSESKKIKTNYGYELIGTLDHKIQVINESGNIIWKRLEDLKINDYAIINYNTNLFGKESLPLDEAYWYGLLAGDGGLSRRKTVTLTNMDEYILDFAKSYLNSKNIKYTLKKSKSKAYDIIISSINYRQKLIDMGFKISLSTNKEIPEFIRKLNKSSLAMFIRGLYETDGWIGKGKNKPSIQIGLSSKKMIDQLHLILLNYGIIASRRVKKTKKQDSHILSIYMGNIKAFINNIGFDPDSRKLKELNIELNKYNAIANPNTDIIPHQHENLKKILSSFLIEKSEKKNFLESSGIKYKTIRSWIRGERNPSRDKLKKFLYWAKDKILDNNNIIINLINNMTYLCDSNLFFDKIKIIENLIAENYDFVIPKTHSFVSQGFVNHNTLAAALITAEFGKSTNIYVIGTDLLYQFFKLFKSIFGDDKVGIVGDGNFDLKDINIVSIWTVGQALGLKKSQIIIDNSSEPEKSDPKKYEDIKKSLKNIKVHIFDECHLSASATFTAIHNAISPEHIYGMSGTPWRDDGADLMIETILGKKIIDIPASKLIDDGYLVPPTIKFIPVPPLDKDVNKQYQTIYKEYIIDNDVRNDLVAKAAQKLVDQNFQTLVLFKKIDHGKILYDKISKIMPCILLSGKDDIKTRELAKSELESGKVNCIIASQIFDIGVDLPSLSGLVIAGSGKSSVRALQRIGRVIRKHPGKKQAAIIDFVDQAEFLLAHSKVRRKIYESEERFKVIWPMKSKK